MKTSFLIGSVCMANLQECWDSLALDTLKQASGILLHLFDLLIFWEKMLLKLSQNCEGVRVDCWHMNQDLSLCSVV